MPRLTKGRLIGLIEAAAGQTGWTVTPLSARGEHPFRFEMARGSVRHRVRAYIWNISHGGGARRPRNEYRIQITRVSQFEPEPGGITLILGWSEAFGVFAGFDINHHAQPLGSSPSIQIGAAALEEAGREGMATHVKANREVAVAVRPDWLPTYIFHHDEAHREGVHNLLLPDLDAIDFPELASPEREHHVGHAAEMAQRRTVLERLAALERAVEAIKPQIGMMGHNNPPEPMGADPEILANEIADAAKTIGTALGEEEPDMRAVARGAGTLQRIWKMLRAAREEAAKVAKEARAQVREKAAEIVLKGALAATALYGKEIFDALGSAVSAISHWFRLIL